MMSLSGAHVIQEDVIASECWADDGSFSDNSVLKTLFEWSGAGTFAGIPSVVVVHVEVQASEKGWNSRGLYGQCRDVNHAWL